MRRGYRLQRLVAPLPTHRGSASARPYTLRCHMQVTKWPKSLVVRAAELWSEGLDIESLLSRLHDESEEFRAIDEKLVTYDAGFRDVRVSNRDLFPPRGRSERHNGALKVRPRIINVRT